MDPVELRIDVPFGTLAAKVWGPADGKPVLALHGWLDSAASYDTLCPLLNPSLRIVALDFSGHGDSSHKPPGCHYNPLEYVIDVRRAVDHLGWDQFTLIGHSMPAYSTEAEYTVPYGSLAAKLWGDPAKASVRVLALHGWRNNAGTFDTLIPLLSSEMFVVALDLSGHGLSSHKPPGCSYSYHEYVMDVCRVVQQLKWQDRFCIVGHSFGCTVGMMYAALFPDRVRALVALDLYAPLHVPRERLVQDTSKLMSSFLHLEAKLGEAPTYTEEELLKRLHEATLFTLNTDTMRILMARDVVPASSGPENGKKLRMRTDPRTKVISTVLLDADFQYALMENLRCDLIMITASEIDERIMRGSMERFFALYERCCSRFKHVEVQGNHYVHLNHPERVAPLINDFLIEKAPSA